jgi:hypothetical protein
MIIRVLIIFSIILQGFNFAGSLNLSQCKILKSKCCETPKIYCCKKSNICKCTIKKPFSSPAQKKEIIISKNTDELCESQKNQIDFVLQLFNSASKFQTNFNLKTYQAYTNLPMLA